MRSLSLIATAATAALAITVSASATPLPGQHVGQAGLAHGVSAFASTSASVQKPTQLWLHIEGRVESVLGKVKCTGARSAPIVEFAPGVYALPVPVRGADKCDVFADANGSGRVFVEVRANRATARHANT